MKFGLILATCAICFSSVASLNQQKNSMSLKEDNVPQSEAYNAKSKVLGKTDSTTKTDSKSRLRAELEGPIASALDLKWDHSAESILKLATEAISMANDTISNMVETKGPRTYGNTVVPLAAFETWVAQKTTPIVFLTQVSDQPDIREAAKKFEKQINDFQTELWMREDLYHMFKSYVESAKQDQSFDKLDKEAQRYINKTLEDFETQGMKLPKEQRSQLIQLQKEISELESKAEANIAEDKSKAAFHINELQGLPRHLVAKLEKVKGKKDMVYLNTNKKKGPMAMAMLENPETRKKMNLLMENVCADKNVPIINQLVQKRDKVAKMLGYTSYSQFAMVGRMAEKVENVEKLLDDLTHKITPIGRRELQAMTDFKRTFKGHEKDDFEMWDRSFYLSKFNKKHNGFEESTIGQYFPAEHVKTETMNIYQELFGLKFTQVKGAKTWHKDVPMYEVKDKKSDQLLGHFYLDLYPRQDKFNHAACMTLLKRENSNGKITSAAAAMVSNFQPGKPGESVTLSHREVVTFFHEFGHVMHNMCNEANFSRFAGASVEKDFVEMPSQMLENWIWNKEIIKRMSKHVKTGEKMPEDLIQKKIASKNLHVASETLNQVMLATVDLLLNSANDNKLLAEVPHRPALAQFFSDDDSISRMRADLKFKDGNIDTGALWRKLSLKIESSRYQDGANPIGTFGHLISGYVSSYYSYIWSQVYSDDLYAQFEKAGVLNPDIGMKYRKTILAPGGSRDSIESLRLFLGRDPNHDAFMKNNFKEVSTKEE